MKRIYRLRSGKYRGYCYIGDRRYTVTGTRAEVEDKVEAIEKKYRAGEETEKSRMKRKRSVCLHCKYASTHEEKQVSRLTCDYILSENKMRPCDARDCVKEGVFCEG